MCHGSRVILVSHDCVLLQDVRDYIGQISQTRFKLNVKSPVICQRSYYEQNVSRRMIKKNLELESNRISIDYLDYRHFGPIGTF